MNNEQIFLDFFKGLKTGEITNSKFTEELKASILKTYNSMNKDGVEFIIEPEYSSINDKSENMLRMSGKFVYGFEKDGIFHDVPGDTRTAREREAIEEGYFDAYFDEDRNIIGIYESLAGNWFGKKPESKKGFFAKLFG